MDEEKSTPGAQHSPHVVVHPVQHPEQPAERPFRRVEILGVQVGKSYSEADVEELCRRAGLSDIGVTDPQLVDWRGGGPQRWTA